MVGCFQVPRPGSMIVVQDICDLSLVMGDGDRVMREHGGAYEATAMLMGELQ